MSTELVGRASPEEIQKLMRLLQLVRYEGKGYHGEDYTDWLGDWYDDWYEDFRAFPPRAAWDVLVQILGTPQFQEFSFFLEPLAQSECPLYQVIFVVRNNSEFPIYSHDKNPG